MPTPPTLPRPPALFVRRGKDFEPATPEDVLCTAESIVAERFHLGRAVLPDITATRRYVSLKFADRPVQTFVILLLNVRQRLIATVELFHGTLDHVRLYPRELLREALTRGAAAAILIRTDPAGNPEPTREDLLSAERAAQAFALLDMSVLDYLIVGEEITSLKERRYL